VKKKSGIFENFIFSPKVFSALKNGDPVVALETAVITHGLPYPENFQLAHDLENIIYQLGAIPASIGAIDGKIIIGLDEEQIERLAKEKNLKKINSREFANIIFQQSSGGTTVSGTLVAAHFAGIKVFVTGGIGGVHRNAPFDISADLPQLSRIPMIVVCSGAKSILDLNATLEFLETWSIPVIGYQTEEFPAFFSKNSGLKTSGRVNSADEVVKLARIHWSLGFESAVLITVPPPDPYSIPFDDLSQLINKAVEEAEIKNIHGQELTPFLLSKIVELTNGKSLQVNLSLLKNNAQIGAQIALKLI
jgi:pseudouridine-5'-phosphate glycosidase